MSKFVAFDTYDIRFPTSRRLYGSDAMNPAPDYAAAYVVVRVDAELDGAPLEGHGFSFTIGRGNEVQLSAIRCLEPLVVGLDCEQVLSDLGSFSRRLVWDSPLRWLGPEKGVMHMAIGAVVNAMWDLKAKQAGKPLWRLLCDLSPEELVSLVDFRYLSDVLDPSEAVDLLAERSAGLAGRVAVLERQGFPAYTTSAGWLGFDDARLVTLCREAVRAGFGLVKLKVGDNQSDDLRRCGLAREAIGEDVALAVDANQVWDVDESVRRIQALSRFDLAWVEEPTSPDEVLGLARIRRAVDVPVAAGEHVANRVLFKQLLQCAALDIMQIDACRVAGVNENIANLLMAAKFGTAVCPHAGGVGLCELVRHLALFNHAYLDGARLRSGQAAPTEWIDGLHEHFTDPARVEGGRYVLPLQPGASTTMRAESIRAYRYPEGAAWAGAATSPGDGSALGELAREGEW
ncbi:MAG TPA: enolase C-terminal domain-like protein [Acidimicrobiales bacterium]|nr:enolase C-terminal domain-like protein [Acidimicrobiales bacterium]